MVRAQEVEIVAGHLSKDQQPLPGVLRHLGLGRGFCVTDEGVGEIAAHELEVFIDLLGDLFAGPAAGSWAVIEMGEIHIHMGPMFRTAATLHGLCAAVIPETLRRPGSMRPIRFSKIKGIFRPTGSVSFAIPMPTRIVDRLRESEGTQCICLSYSGFSSRSIY